MADVDPVAGFQSDLMAVVDKWRIALDPLVLSQAMQDVLGRLAVPFAPLPEASKPPEIEPPAAA